MTRPLPILLLATGLLAGTVAMAPAPRAAEPPAGPALSVGSGELAQALHCPGSFHGAHNPVLFVHGTTLTAASNWSWNYAKVLPGQGYDVCTVDLPDRARADIQTSAQYVVYAVRDMAARSHRKVDVVGFSQGPLEPRWAVKFWPDVRADVDHLVGMAGVGHGFSETEGICAPDCIAPFWQMRPASHFLGALNAGGDTLPGISYTSVYSRTDQFVWLADGGGNPWDRSAQLAGASNVAVQDICPGRYVEHIQAVYDAVYYAVVMDALTHPGGADPARIDRSVCTQVVMPGVDPGQAGSETAEIDRDLLVLTSQHHARSEPALAAYAGG